MRVRERPALALKHTRAGIANPRQGINLLPCRFCRAAQPCPRSVRGRLEQGRGTQWLRASGRVQTVCARRGPPCRGRDRIGRKPGLSAAHAVQVEAILAEGIDMGVQQRRGAGEVLVGDHMPLRTELRDDFADLQRVQITNWPSGTHKLCEGQSENLSAEVSAHFLNPTGFSV